MTFDGLGGRMYIDKPGMPVAMCRCDAISHKLSQALSHMVAPVTSRHAENPQAPRNDWDRIVETVEWLAAKDGSNV